MNEPQGCMLARVRAEGRLFLLQRGPWAAPQPGQGELRRAGAAGS